MAVTTDNDTRRGDRLRVVGLGRAGCNVISRITDERGGRFPAVALSTDARTLEACRANTKLQIGQDLTGGMGAGGDPETGRLAAEEDYGLIRGMFEDTDVVFLVAGLGGGTGTGAAPVVVRAAHEAGAMTICLVTTPFRFEGADCVARAEEGLRSLLDAVDVGVLVPNENMFRGGGDMKLKEAFLLADESLGMGVCALWQLIAEEGVINLGFAELRNLIRGHGEAYSLGYGSGKGAGRAETAVTAALSNPLLGESSVEKAESLLVGIAGDSEMTLSEINKVMDHIRGMTKKTAGVFMGAVVDDEMAGTMMVTILASQRRVVSVPVPEEDESADREDSSDGTELLFDGAGEITQTDLNLVTPEKQGRFKDVEPTILHGEDLDVPTYVRRGVTIEK